jgi:Xaa-Pro aminopeptidase
MNNQSHHITIRVQVACSIIQHHKAWAWVFPSGDPHCSEYPADRFKVRAYISGFQGSAGTAVVLADGRGALWTDGRYFLEAEQVLKETPFELMPMGEPDTPTIQQWIDQTAKEAGFGMSGPLESRNVLTNPAVAPVLFDPLTVSPGFLRQEGIKNSVFVDGLVDQLWKDRPSLVGKPIRDFPITKAGRSREQKLDQLVSALDGSQAQGAQAMVVSALDEIAWVLNLRGEDVEFNPVFYGYLVIRDPKILQGAPASSGKKVKPKSLAYGFEDIPNEQDSETWSQVQGSKAILFTDQGRISKLVRQNLDSAGVGLLDYEDFLPWLKGPGSKLRWWVNPQQISLAVEQILGQGEHGFVSKELPSTLAKSMKHPQELSSLRSCMVEDGEALVKAFSWIEANIKANISFTEGDVAEQLRQVRGKVSGFLGESFDTIAGFKGNGAIIHYRPQPDSWATIDSKHHRGLLLIDSGGQYDQGTTDVTRTLVVGEPTAEEIQAYTLVLKGHVQLSMALFPKGTNGTQLDTLARQPLWQQGVNYGHGTGHGVGFALNVHEGPGRISPVPNPVALQPGMVFSNEPGLYTTGQWGVRIENLVVVRTLEDLAGKGLHQSVKPTQGFLGFETLTLCPYEPKLIDRSLLTDQETQWINSYHRWVYEALSPGLTGDDLAYLKEKTLPLE